MSDSMRRLRQRRLQAGQKLARLVLVACGIVLAASVILSLLGLGKSSPPASTPQEAGAALPGPTITPSPPPPPPPPTAAATPAPHAPHVGIVVGHWWLDEDAQQSLDVGAVCDEGTPHQLTELEINLEVAQRVVFELRKDGYRVDLLQEWDDRLSGYQADALLSIHADACLYPEASGFKVVRVTDSHVPEIEDRLVACLIERYAARTGLPFHEGSITYDMLHYHTFYEIDPNTPGAIIEVGFMLADRALLTQRPDLVAQGIVDGIRCFLEGEGLGRSDG